jgi:hypothetical protein
MKKITPEASAERREHSIRISGTINGIRYRLGVPNPFNRRRNPASLDARHLPAFALFGFVDPARLEKGFAISEVQFTCRFQAENAWSSWEQTRT